MDLLQVSVEALDLEDGEEDGLNLGTQERFDLEHLRSGYGSLFGSSTGCPHYGSTLGSERGRAAGLRQGFERQITHGR